MNFKYNNSKSDYAINKNTDDIVYKFADDSEICYRKIDGKIYMIINSVEMVEISPQEMSIEKFDWIKAKSDENHHEIEKQVKRTTIHDVSLNELMETDCVAEKSAEQEYIDHLDTLDISSEFRSMENAMIILDKCLTKLQKKRFLLYYYKGKNITEIAAMERVYQYMIWKTIQACNKKIKKYFEKL